MPAPASVAPVSVLARGWGWRFGGRSTPAVTDLDLAIEPGERILLLGASGSGKSTLLAALAGVLGEDEGHVTGDLLLDGAPVASQRGRVGLVLQDPDNQVILERIGDDVAFGCENLGLEQDEIWSRVADALARVGLNLPLSHSTSRLSGGQKQRLALAGVLAMSPGLILLDEPTANLDPEGVREVRLAVQEVADATGATVVLVEHRVDIWQDFATRTVVLGNTDGVWMPGMAAPAPKHSGQPGSGDELLRATALVSSYTTDSPRGMPLTACVRSGEILALTGPNGSGKTATALSLAGLNKPRFGELTATASLRGSVRSTEPATWRSRDLLTRLGMVFQAPEQQFLTGRVWDELAVGPRALRHSPAQVSARVDELLDRLHLAELAQAHPFTLSGGQKRRLSVATALATAPHVLVLDEPTFGQDARTWVSLVDLVSELRSEGRGIVAVTHDEKFVAALADEIVQLRQPEVVSL